MVILTVEPPNRSPCYFFTIFDVAVSFWSGIMSLGFSVLKFYLVTFWLKVDTNFLIMGRWISSCWHMSVRRSKQWHRFYSKSPFDCLFFWSCLLTKLFFFSFDTAKHQVLADDLGNFEMRACYSRPHLCITTFHHQYWDWMIIDPVRPTSVIKFLRWNNSHKCNQFSHKCNKTFLKRNKKLFRLLSVQVLTSCGATSILSTKMCIYLVCINVIKKGTWLLKIVLSAFRLLHVYILINWDNLYPQHQNLNLPGLFKCEKNSTWSIGGWSRSSAPKYIFTLFI